MFPLWVFRVRAQLKKLNCNGDKIMNRKIKYVVVYVYYINLNFSYMLRSTVRDKLMLHLCRDKHSV